MTEKIYIPNTIRDNKEKLIILAEGINYFFHKYGNSKYSNGDIFFFVTYCPEYLLSNFIDWNNQYQVDLIKEKLSILSKRVRKEFYKNCS